MQAEERSSRGERFVHYIEQSAFLNTLFYKSGILDAYLCNVVHKREKLSDAEQTVLTAYISSLKSESRQTKKPVIVCMVGIVGSGKSTVAREIAAGMKATVVEGDAVRVALRNAGQPYDAQRKMTEDAALAVVGTGANVILDGDFMPLAKRASLVAKARKVGAEVVFVRTTCDYDVMVGRTNSAKDAGEFFEGASSEWKGDKKGFTVKMRELWRRTPNHYVWDPTGGGTWRLKSTRFKIFATVDTTHNTTSTTSLIAKKINSSF